MVPKDQASREVEDTMAGRVAQAGAPGYHAVRFYESDRSLAAIVANFLGEGIADGQPAIVVATAAQRAAIVRALVAKDFDVVHLKRSNNLLLVDAERTLDMFMTNGEVDAVRFRDVMCGILTEVCRDRPNCTVRIYGQMVDVLWKDGQQEAAVRLEMLWNQLGTSERFSLLCGYAMGHFFKDVAFQKVCAQHTHIVSADGTSERVA